MEPYNSLGTVMGEFDLIFTPREKYYMSSYLYPYPKMYQGTSTRAQDPRTDLQGVRVELLSDSIRSDFEPVECLAGNACRRGWRLIAVVKDNGDNGGRLSQWRHLGVVGHRLTSPIEHRRSRTQ